MRLKGISELGFQRIAGKGSPASNTETGTRYFLDWMGRQPDLIQAMQDVWSQSQNEYTFSQDLPLDPTVAEYSGGWPVDWHQIIQEFFNTHSVIAGKGAQAGDRELTPDDPDYKFEFYRDIVKQVCDTFESIVAEHNLTPDEAGKFIEELKSELDMYWDVYIPSLPLDKIRHM